MVGPNYLLTEDSRRKLIGFGYLVIVKLLPGFIKPIYHMFESVNDATLIIDPLAFEFSFVLVLFPPVFTLESINVFCCSDSGLWFSKNNLKVVKFCVSG